jgi:hypothetical protein
MLKKLFLLGGLGVLFLGMIAFANHSSAADEYTFLVRGDVMQVDGSQKTIKVYSRWTNSAAENDMGGQTVEINVKSAAFYKYDDKQRKVRTTLGSIDRGDEVVVRGAKKAGGNYNASWVVRNDNLVDIKGTVDSHTIGGHRETNDYGILKVNLESMVFSSTGKAYKASAYPKSTVIRVFYDKDSVKFKSREGKDMNADEMKNSNEKVTLENVRVKYGSRFEGTGQTPVMVVTDDKWLF